MSANINDRLPTLGSSATPDNPPTAQEQSAAGAYEPPRLVPAGNLLELLGKSGLVADYRERRFHQKRP